MYRSDGPFVSTKESGGDSDLRTRICASVLGISAGDMLGGACGRRSGSTLDADTESALKEFALFGNLAESLKVSDDTLLTVEALKSIAAIGFVCREDVTNRYLAMDTRGGRQILKLRGSDYPHRYSPIDGLTNGAILRAASVSVFHGSNAMNDVLYDALKLASITHGHPNALSASLMFAAALAMALDGAESQSIRAALIELEDPICRICGGGRLVFDNFHHALEIIERHEFDKVIDSLELSIGLSVSASSSAVTGIALGLAYPDIRSVLPTLLRRIRSGWDLDSTAAVYGAVSGALRPNGQATNGIALLRDDIFFDLEPIVDCLIERRRKREELVSARMHPA